MNFQRTSRFAIITKHDAQLAVKSRYLDVLGESLKVNDKP